MKPKIGLLLVFCKIINKGLLDDNLALRDELLEVRREVEELRKGA
jgi:hypothetical protein